MNRYGVIIYNKQGHKFCLVMTEQQLEKFYGIMDDLLDDFALDIKPVSCHLGKERLWIQVTQIASIYVEVIIDEDNSEEVQ